MSRANVCLCTHRSWNSAISEINGTVSTVPTGLRSGYQPPTPTINHRPMPTSVKYGGGGGGGGGGCGGGGGGGGGGGNIVSPGVYTGANLGPVAHTYVSPGMWQDCVAAVYADTRKPFQFQAGEGEVWVGGGGGGGGGGH